MKTRNTHATPSVLHYGVVSMTTPRLVVFRIRKGVAAVLILRVGKMTNLPNSWQQKFI